MSPASALSWRVLLILAVLALVPDRAWAAGRPDVPIVPRPSWVSPAPFEGKPHPAGAVVLGGVIEELIDHQVKVGATVERYTRRVRRATTLGGVEDVAQIEIAFAPSYERLRLHGATLLRGERRIDALKGAQIRVLDQEDDLDDGVYRGELTAVVVLRDVRVGDAIDLDFTITGENPVFGGKFHDDERLGLTRGVDYVRVRALLPEGRSITARTYGGDIAPVEGVSGGARELVWERRDVPASPEEDDTPSWFDATPHVSLSELATWEEVARWATPLFDRAIVASAPVTEKAAEITARAPAPEERALAALRFVQDEIRYQGVEMGVNSHRPRDAGAVIEARFGDCKDKVALLVALLRALGVEAQPALVNTDLRAHIADRPPSPGAFDHAIARIHLADRDVWVDPTRSNERGPLGASPVTLGRGLILEAKTTDLSVIPPPPPLTVPTIDGREVFTFRGTAASLEVTTTYRGRRADHLREELAETPLDTLRTKYLNYYAAIYPEISSDGDLKVDDDDATDTLVVVEKYALEGPLHDGQLDVAAAAVRALVDKPEVTRRQTPLSVPFPAFARNEVVVTGLRLRKLEENIQHDAAMDFTRRWRREGGTSTIIFELKTLADEVPAAAVPAHVALLGEIDDAATPSLDVSESAGKTRGTPEVSTGELIWGVVIVGVIVVGVSARPLVRSMRKQRWRKKARVESGETPALARKVATRGAAERVLLEGRCRCGGGFTLAPDGGWSAVHYAERAVTAGRATCEACGERRVRYFEGGLAE